MTTIHEKKAVSPIISVVLSLILVLSGVASFAALQPSTAEAAGEIPGTLAYYDARWNEAIHEKGYVAAGTGKATVEGPWKLSIDNCSAPWNGNAATATQYNALANVNVTNATGGTVVAKKVTTAEQMRYCVENGKSFQLQNNIDLNGYTGKQWTLPRSTATTAFVADGNGFTIYNYYVSGQSETCGLFGAVTSTLDTNIIKNVRISNSYIKENDGSAAFFTTSGRINLNSVAVELSWIKTKPNPAAERYIGGVAYSTRGNIAQSYVRDVVLYNPGKNDGSANAHIAGFCTPSAYGDNITYCFVTDSVVISNGGHSGGFASCGNATATISNCFSNADIYGNRNVGGFYGITGTGSITLNNCYSTGKLEGVSNLGGFFGAMVNEGATTLTITNCYSSVLVGLQSDGENIAGFATGQTMADKTSKMTNCYAVGEVGSIETEVGPTRTDAQSTSAGFIAAHNGSNSQYFNCYYDKQTTAMREWAQGAPTAANARTSDQCQAYVTSGTTRMDIEGRLTTTSAKSGTGMTDPAFCAMLNNGGSAFVQDAGYYPELNVFKSATGFTNSKWMSTTDLRNFIKAASQASVSTVHLDTYDKDYGGTALPKTTYDTVRDVTSKFPLTSASNLGWKRVGVTGSATLATGTGAKSDAFVIAAGDEQKDIIDLYKQGSTWYGDHPMPGVDWVKVATDIGGQKGARALRICPTVGLDAGMSRYIGRGELYDHADDMNFVYTTGARTTDADPSNDYTYGVYPDVPLAPRQQQILAASAFSNVSALTSKYGGAGQDNAFSKVDVLYMQRTGTALDAGVPARSTPNGGYLNEVIIHEVVAENADGTILLGDKLNLSDPAEADKWNGITPFSGDGTHKVYCVEYVWSLADGRYITDTKRIEYPMLAHNVSISVENPAGERLPNKAYVDAYSISNESGDVDESITPAFGGRTKAQDWLINQSHAHPAATAWMLTDESEPITEVRITIRSIDGEIERTTILPASALPQTAGDTTNFDAIAPYRVYSYDSNNELVWRAYELTKTYTITLDETGVYNIKFDKEYADYVNGVYVDDIDMDVDVVVVIDGEVPIDEPTEFNFSNTREDKPWASGKADVENEMPSLKEGGE